MDYRKTQHYRLENDLPACSYCHVSQMEWDDFDERGGYIGQYFQCDCEEAKIELQMNQEIAKIEIQIEKIKQAYSDRLSIDWNKVYKNQKEAELLAVKRKYEDTID